MPDQIAAIPSRAEASDVVFIDWISTKEHRSFNESMLAALQVKDALLFIFADVMRVAGQRNIVQFCKGGRVARAWKVWRICWRLRRRPIFLLSYDAMMFPVLQLFCRRLFVYEHNTTPEGRLFRKHAVWQRLLFRRVTRFAQFHAQHEILKGIGQNSHYLGSPLPERLEVVRTHPSLFIAPSDRIEMETLLKLKPLVGSDEIIIRNYKFSADELGQIKAKINVKAVAYIDLEHYLPLTKGVVIAIASKIRGSGWFNEAIRFGVPLIIVEKGVQEIFETTFPAYPYVALDTIASPLDLDNALVKVASFDGRSYIVAHNEQLRNTFERVVGQARPE